MSHQVEHFVFPCHTKRHPKCHPKPEKRHFRPSQEQSERKNGLTTVQISVQAVQMPLYQRFSRLSHPYSFSLSALGPLINSPCRIIAFLLSITPPSASPACSSELFFIPTSSSVKTV